VTSLEALPRELATSLASARDVEAACEATTSCLQAAGVRLASIYLHSGGLLRCLGVRGYGQLFDGIPPGLGVIGTAFASGRRLHVRTGDDGEGYRARRRAWPRSWPCRCTSTGSASASSTSRAPGR
jgi:hypothetical protein